MIRKPRAEQTHGEYLPYLLNRVTALINAPLQRALRRRGLTMTHWRVLGFLAERDGLVIGELADRTVTDFATLSRALDRLQERGFVERRVAAHDSRQFEVHLLAAGRDEYTVLQVEARRVEDWAFEGIDPGELEHLHDLLEALSMRLTDRSGGTAAPSTTA